MSRINFGWGRIPIHLGEGEVVKADIELASQALVFAHLELGFELGPVFCG